jgi:alkylation response protein AidB-like acyl-CoA dehydrogenase/electron transfer flavoprotein alpha subunit
VLTNLGMGRMDTAFGLLIMASTSIGTMPVMLGRDKDLPGLRAELDACLADQAGWRALRGGLKRLLRMLDHPQPKPFRQAMEQWGKRIQGMLLFPGSTLKYLGRSYLMLVQQTVETAKRRDMQALGVKLRACSSGLDDLHRLLVEELDSLALREQAHARFLSFLACGQISAFALTEPSAGSDTGGIQTRAVLREVAAEYDGVGFYTFVPYGKTEPRVLLDAGNLRFNDRSVTYRLADGREGLLDDSGWDMRRNSGRRAIRTVDALYEFDDIGTPLQRHGRTVYRYWEVSGNKMWITNGSVADRYSLYSQSAEGDIGFMLERRSEGLRIGPNENKLGQRASPTNELTLDRVRISADQVIGFRGHGQVNALETLSVGRGGLVMSCATLGELLLRNYAHLWRRNPALHEAAQAELDRIQCLAARLVGLMDRADLSQGDFRIEAALSKYIASEGAHRILGWLETLLGPQSAANEVIVEKLRRDIRILNIYEGTNEVQRFLALKDLPNLLREPASAIDDNPPLESALQAFREFATPRVTALGASLWQNPDLQTRWFPVVDWLADLYSWCALHERMRLLKSHADPVDDELLRRLRAVENSLAEHVQRRAHWVRASFAGGEEGRCYPADASLVLARAALAGAAETDAGPWAIGALSGEIALVLRSRATLGEQGLAWDGWHEADRAVLDRLLAWARHNPQLKIKVAAVAPRGVDDRLRQLLATGVELLHVAQPAGAMDTAAVADAVLRRWPSVTRWAFGRRGANAHDQAFVAQMAQWLALEVAQDITAVGEDEHGPWIENARYQRHRVASARRLGWVWDIKPSGHSERYSAHAWLAALRAELPRVEPASAVRVSAPRAAPPPPASDLPESFASPAALAQWLKQRFGSGAQPEPAARWRETDTPLGAPVLWLAPADTLAAVRGLAAPRLVRDLRAQDHGLLVWHDAAAPLPPISSRVQQPGLRGVWTLPLEGVVDANVLAHALKPHIHLPRRLVLESSQREAGAALAACLGIALFDRVIGLEGDTVTCAYDGYVADHVLPESALLVAGAEYKDAALAEASATELPLTRLPRAMLQDNALTRWQAQATPAGPGLATARLVLDIGLGIGDEAQFQQRVPPLAAVLGRLSGDTVALGATRKITQELKLLPVQQQIGQTGIAVAPALLFALGISGAPQHMSWIDPKAVVIAINRDPAAPIFTWHKQNAGPRVIACVGDLQVWLPELVRLLSS